MQEQDGELNVIRLLSGTSNPAEGKCFIERMSCFSSCIDYYQALSS